MKDTERRRLETFIRVHELGAADAALFPPTSFAGEQLAILASVISALETHASAQASGKSTVRESATSKAAARDELLQDLEAISRTARAMAITTPGLDNKFRVPRNLSNQAVLAVARATFTDALPFKAEFIRRGLPASFLEDLQADIEALEEAITRKVQGHKSHVLATAAIDAEIERGMNVVRELDPLMRNIFVANTAKLAAWLSASRVERPPHRKPAAAAPPPPTPSPK
jgi:hypothetical protein